MRFSCTDKYIYLQQWDTSSKLNNLCKLHLFPSFYTTSKNQVQQKYSKKRVSLGKSIFTLSWMVSSLSWISFFRPRMSFSRFLMMLSNLAFSAWYFLISSLWSSISFCKLVNYKQKNKNTDFLNNWQINGLKK